MDSAKNYAKAIIGPWAIDKPLTPTGRRRTGHQARQAWPAGRRSRAPVRPSATARATSPPWRRAPRRPRHLGRLRARHDTTPSTSATMTSPGWMATPAHTTGTLTRTGRGLHGALRGNRLGPHGELQRGQVGRVAHAGVDQQPDHAVRAGRHGQQIAEHAVGRLGRRRHDEYVALTARLDRHVDDQVVARLTAVRAGATGDAGRRDRWAACTDASGPIRPCASCTVATPRSPSMAMMVASARWMLRTIVGFIRF